MKKNDYILIIAKMPTILNEKDGMIQRELAIDSVFENYKRIYISDVFSFNSLIKYPKKFFKSMFDFFKRKDTKCFANNNVKLYNSISLCILRKLCKNAKLIYVHSLYYLEKLPCELIQKYKDKIVIDIHGCVVEELEYMNCDFEKYSKLENFAFPIVKNLISVSQNMIEFYKNKYPQTTEKYINLPIFIAKTFDDINKNNNDKIHLIYSGGIQKWQNIDIMVKTISKIINNFDVTILTSNIEYFSDILAKYDIKDKVKVKSVPYSKIANEYVKADFGFILRDDIVVNKVACPTKVIEYMQYGIVPIVLQPNIGDFCDLGYSYLLNDDLINGKIPSKQEIKFMRENNYKVMEKLNLIQSYGKKELLLLAD